MSYLCTISCIHMYTHAFPSHLYRCSKPSINESLEQLLSEEARRRFQNRSRFFFFPFPHLHPRYFPAPSAANAQEEQIPGKFFKSGRNPTTKGRESTIAAIHVKNQKQELYELSMRTRRFLNLYVLIPPTIIKYLALVLQP